MNVERMPQAHVLFAGIGNYQWSNGSPQEFNKAIVDVEATGGKIWYLFQKGTSAEDMIKQYADLEKFLTCQGHQHDCWTFVHDTKNASLSAEQKFFMDTAGELLWIRREGFSTWVDMSDSDYDFFFRGIEFSLVFTRDPQGFWNDRMSDPNNAP